MTSEIHFCRWYTSKSFSCSWAYLEVLTFQAIRLFNRKYQWSKGSALNYLVKLRKTNHGLDKINHMSRSIFSKTSFLSQIRNFESKRLEWWEKRESEACDTLLYCYFTLVPFFWAKLSILTPVMDFFCENLQQGICCVNASVRPSNRDSSVSERCRSKRLGGIVRKKNTTVVWREM